MRSARIALMKSDQIWLPHFFSSRRFQLGGILIRNSYDARSRLRCGMALLYQHLRLAETPRMHSRMSGGTRFRQWLAIRWPSCEFHSRCYHCVQVNESQLEIPVDLIGFFR